MFRNLYCSLPGLTSHFSLVCCCYVITCKQKAVNMKISTQSSKAKFLLNYAKYILDNLLFILIFQVGDGRCFSCPFLRMRKLHFCLLVECFQTPLFVTEFFRYLFDAVT